MVCRPGRLARPTRPASTGRRSPSTLVTLVLLALADVEPDAIAADYALSTEAVRTLFAAMGISDQGPMIESVLTRRGTTIQAAVLDALRGFEAEHYLRGAGVGRADIQIIRDRLA